MISIRMLSNLFGRALFVDDLASLESTLVNGSIGDSFKLASLFS